MRDLRAREAARDRDDDRAAHPHRVARDDELGAGRGGDGDARAVEVFSPLVGERRDGRRAGGRVGERDRGELGGVVVVVVVVARVVVQGARVRVAASGRARGGVAGDGARVFVVRVRGRRLVGRHRRGRAEALRERARGAEDGAVRDLRARGGDDRDRARVRPRDVAQRPPQATTRRLLVKAIVIQRMRRRRRRGRGRGRVARERTRERPRGPHRGFPPRGAPRARDARGAARRDRSAAEPAQESRDRRRAHHRPPRVESM